MLANVAPSAAAVGFPSMSSSATNEVVTQGPPGEWFERDGSDRIEATDPLVERDVAVVGQVPREAENPFGHQVLEHLRRPAGNGEARRPAQPFRPSVGGRLVRVPG